MNQQARTTVTVTTEASLLDHILDNAQNMAAIVAKTEKVYAPTFITDKQKSYITVLRGQARELGLHTLADKKVRNRSEASDYIGELKATIAKEKAKPKRKPCGCGR